MNNLKEALNAKYGCDPECADRNPDNKQFEYSICIAYSTKLYSLDDVAHFIESFETTANARYTAMFNSSDIFVHDSANPNQNIIEIKGFHSISHATNYIKIIESLKNTFGYNKINIESYVMLYNNCEESIVTTDEELDYINHELTMGEVLNKEIAEHPEILAERKEAVFPNEDPVNHPGHYIQDGIEMIDVIKAWTKGLDGIIAIDTGNIIKYISRWNKKNGIEDLKKAQWYLNHLIKEMEERMQNDCCC